MKPKKYPNSVLADAMSNWTKMIAFLAREEPPASILARMWRIEKNSHQRPVVLTRLMSKYAKACKAELERGDA